MLRGVPHRLLERLVHPHPALAAVRDSAIVSIASFIVGHARVAVLVHAVTEAHDLAFLGKRRV